MSSNPDQWVHTTVSKPPSKRTYTTEKDWEVHKERILELRKGGVQLSKIKSIIEQETGFVASISQYKQRLQRWGDKRHFTKKQRLFIAQQVQKRGGKAPAFRDHNGDLVDSERVLRVIKRNPGEADAWIDSPLSPDGLLVMSPAPARVPSPSPDPVRLELRSPSPTAIDWLTAVEGVSMDLNLDWDLSETTFNNNLAMVQLARPQGPSFYETTDPESNIAYGFLEEFGARVLATYDLIPNFNVDDKETKASLELLVKHWQHKRDENIWRRNVDVFFLALFGHEERISSSARTDRIRELPASESESNTTPEEQNVGSGSSRAEQPIANEALSSSRPEHKGGSNANCSKSIITVQELDAEKSADLTSTNTGSEYKYNVCDDMNRMDMDASPGSLEEDPDFVSGISLYDLANDKYKSYDFLGAEQTLRQASKIFQEKGGLDNPEYIKSQLLLANALSELSRFSDAIDVMDAVARRQEAVLGSDHESVRSIYFDMAWIYWRSDSFDKTWTALSKATLWSWNPSLPVSPQTEVVVKFGIEDWVSRKALALACSILDVEGYKNKAAYWAMAIFKRRQRWYEYMDDQTDLRTLFRLSTIMPNFGLPRESLVISKELENIALTKFHLSSSSETLVKLRHQIHYLSIETDERSEPNPRYGDLLLQDLSTWEATYPYAYVQLSNILNTLGKFYWRSENFTKAIGYFDRCWTLRGNSRGRDHSLTQEVLHSLVTVLNERGLVFYAQPLAKYLLQLRDSSYGPFDATQAEVVKRNFGKLSESMLWAGLF